jgi:hypothetical protein
MQNKMRRTTKARGLETAEILVKQGPIRAAVKEDEAMTEAMVSEMSNMYKRR